MCVGITTDQYLLWPGCACTSGAGQEEIQTGYYFFSFFLLVLGLEWFYFYSDTGNILGRFGIITQTHVAQDELLVTGGQYLLNFLKMVKFRGLLPVVIAAVCVGIWLARRGSSDAKCIAILFLGGLFFHVYMVSSLSPLKLAAPVGSRYLTAAAPYMIIILLIGLDRWSEKSPRVADVFKWGLVIAFASFTIKEVPAQNTLSRLQEDIENAQQINNSQLPVVMRYNAWTPNRIEKVVMDLVGVEKKGRLKVNEDTKMLKNGRRMRIMLFGLPTDKNFRPESLNGYYYLYKGDRASLKEASLVGVSDYSRKGHKLIIVPADSLPQEILRGEK